MALMVNRYPDFVHQAPDVQLGFASVESTSPACWGLVFFEPVLSEPSRAKSRANPTSGYVALYVISAVIALLIVPTALDSFAAVRALIRFGMTIAAAIIATPASAPPLRLTSRTAFSSPYAHMTAGGALGLICKNGAVIPGVAFCMFRAANDAGSS